MAITKSTNQQKLEELQAANGRVAHVEVDGKLYVFRAPSLDEWEDFQENMGGGKKRRGVCFRELAQQTLVHPTLDELQALFQAHPGLTARIGDAVGELAGADIEVTVKKG